MRIPLASLFVAMVVTTTHAEDTAEEPRWFTPDHARIGKRVFDTHCASCHRPAAAGDPNWRQPAEDGLLRPPPLNGTAHAWHHPLSALFQQIVRGSPPRVGNMPAFRRTLSRGEALAAIAYFQSLWYDEIYDAWERMDKASREK
jgi:mono/diheme cytochrome c family protein